MKTKMEQNGYIEHADELSPNQEWGEVVAISIHAPMKKRWWHKLFRIEPKWEMIEYKDLKDE